MMKMKQYKNINRGTNTPFLKTEKNYKTLLILFHIKLRKFLFIYFLSFTFFLYTEVRIKKRESILEAQKIIHNLHEDQVTKRENAVAK